MHIRGCKNKNTKNRTNALLVTYSTYRNFERSTYRKYSNYNKKYFNKLIYVIATFIGVGRRGSCPFLGR